MEILIDKFEPENSGICIVKLDDKYQMCSKPKYGEYVRSIMDIRKNVPLSQAAMEVLAIVNHPIKIDTAGSVESISKITPEILYECYNTFYNLFLTRTFKIAVVIFKGREE